MRDSCILALPCRKLVTRDTIPRHLENSLRREIGFDEEIAARNRIRLLLTTFFKRRDCVGLQRPIIDEGDLGRLASGNVPLREGFGAQIAALKSKVNCPC